MSLDERFKRAVWLIRNGPAKESDNETKLNYYKYYKQATEGDVTGAQVCDSPWRIPFSVYTNGDIKPWAVQLEARAKWDAWNSVKGVSQDEAKQKCIFLMAFTVLFSLY